MIRQVPDQDKSVFRHRLKIFLQGGGMWHWTANLSRSRRARLAAEATILPLVEKSRLRLGAIPDAAWSDPYIVGFMMMLITIIARMEVGRIDSETICHIQAEAWQNITKQENPIGEEVLLLSSARNQDFEMGCRNAAEFASFLVSRSVLLRSEGERNESLDYRSGCQDGASSERYDVLAAWESCFDMRLSSFDHGGVSAFLDRVPR
jgi:hypothetical protein